jgi:hypothetical protein
MADRTLIFVGFPTSRKNMEPYYVFVWLAGKILRVRLKRIPFAHII